MKKFYFSSILMLLVLTGFSQTEKGNWMLGGNIQFSSNHQSDNYNSGTLSTFALNPKIGYFPMNNLAVILNTNYHEPVCRADQLPHIINRSGIAVLCSCIRICKILFWNRCGIRIREWLYQYSLAVRGRSVYFPEPYGGCGDEYQLSDRKSKSNRTEWRYSEIFPFWRWPRLHDLSGKRNAQSCELIFYPVL